MLSDTRLGVVRGISYGLFGPPDQFVPHARALGARVLRAYFFWGQVEPRPGEYRWDAVDALLRQFDGDEEVWITLCSSSPWATRTPTDFLPPSPAHDLAAYAEFVRQMVRRCGGRVQYWQCDNEPSNTALLWAGTADEYLAQLEVLFAAVRAVDPSARVVLGGCGYDVLSSPPSSEQRVFFDRLAERGREAFDVFDVHLYGDPYRIPEYVDMARDFMRAHGYLKPVVAGEYGGPSLFEFPEVEAALQQALAHAFAAPSPAQSTESLAAQANQDTPERLAMKALYAHMRDLPPRLQMFMHACPPELERKRQRIACRQTVMRNVFALSSGIRRTLCWNLAPEVPAAVDPYMLMHLLTGKLPLMDYRGKRLEYRSPVAETFARLAERVDGVTGVSPVHIAALPSVYAFQVERAAREPMFVLWQRRDPFDGECEPSVRVELDWPWHGGEAVDAFGTPQPVTVQGDRIRMQLTDTPVFVEVSQGTHSAVPRSTI